MTGQVVVGVPAKFAYGFECEHFTCVYLIVYGYFRLINIVAHKNVKIRRSASAFDQMENISNFLSACEEFGVDKIDLFQVIDLYEKENMPQVVRSIHALIKVK